MFTDLYSAQCSYEYVSSFNLNVTKTKVITNNKITEEELIS